MKCAYRYCSEQAQGTRDNVHCMDDNYCSVRCMSKESVEWQRDVMKEGIEKVIKSLEKELAGHEKI